MKRTMSKPPRRPIFNRNLARTIRLADGRQVKSLHDARTVMLDVFGSVNARSGLLDHTIERLIEAAESGKRDDIAEATTAVERVLRAPRRLWTHPRQC